MQLKDRSPCLFERDDRPNLPTYASTSNFSYASFHGTFSGSWRQGVFKVTIQDLDRYKVWSIGNNLIDNLCKSHVILIDVHSKRSSTRCFQGHDLHHQVTGFAHAFSFIFFSLRLFFQLLQFKGANFYAKIMQWRIEVTVLFWEPKSIFQRLFKLRGPYMITPDYVILRAVQDARCNTEESP